MRKEKKNTVVYKNLTLHIYFDETKDKKQNIK